MEPNTNSPKLVPSIKYSHKQLKSDSITGFLNGGLFGLIYCFYFPNPHAWTVQQEQPSRLAKLFPKWHQLLLKKQSLNSQYPRLTNFGSYMWLSARMGIAFAVIRVVKKALNKQGVGEGWEVAGTVGAIFVVAGIV